MPAQTLPAASGPSNPARRSFISSAALRVKVTASTLSGAARPEATSQATLWVSTRVLPLPGPASTRSGPRPWVTAFFWASFNPCKTLTIGT